MPPKLVHYVNAEFDLSLRPRSMRRDRQALDRQVRELSAQALLGADLGDAALMRAAVPDEFLEHLDRCGAAVPRLLAHPAVDPQLRLRPFGWNSEAIELNRLQRYPVEHPTLSTIRQVNSRSFSAQLEAELYSDALPATTLESRTALERFLARAPASGCWVIKSEHGNSGLANRRLRSPALTPADVRFVEDLFAEDDRLVIEPWLDRERDWSVVFDVPFDPSTLRIHEVLGTRDGAFIGALFENDPAATGPWIPELGTMAERVAAQLEREEYFGPVCVDGFSWHDGGRVRLRPFVDLNCRLSISDGAFRLWRRLAPDRTLYYRFFNRRKFSLPSDLVPAVCALEARRYEPSQSRGILFASPFRFGDAGENWLPTKIAVAFVGSDREDTFALERWFRARFES